LPVAPTKSSSVVTDSRPQPASTGSAATWLATAWKSSVPNWLNTSSMPMMNAKSPMRLTTKAFLPASIADRFLYQKPISRYEQRPTPSHPTNIIGKFAPSTSTSMNAANRLRYEK
jgi:hypothetical protein